MRERYVVAHIEISVPLDTVTPDDSRLAKQDAVADLMEQMIHALPSQFNEHVGHGRWEDVDERSMQNE